MTIKDLGNTSIRPLYSIRPLNSKKMTTDIKTIKIISSKLADIPFPVFEVELNLLMKFLLPEDLDRLWSENTNDKIGAKSCLTLY